MSEPLTTPVSVLRSLTDALSEREVDESTIALAAQAYSDESLAEAEAANGSPLAPDVTPLELADLARRDARAFPMWAMKAAQYGIVDLPDGGARDYWAEEARPSDRALLWAIISELAEDEASRNKLLAADKPGAALLQATYDQLD